jgi:hypothetical protein
MSNSTVGTIGEGAMTSSAGEEAMTSGVGEDAMTSSMGEEASSARRTEACRGRFGRGVSVTRFTFGCML